MNSDALFKDLVALEESSFPKKCPNCGTCYHSIEEFTSNTQQIRDTSGLKSSQGENGETILELFRNCRCGSTLLDFFENRRTDSDKAQKQRQSFENIIQKLIAHDLDRQSAKDELRKYMKQGKSEVLERIGLFKLQIK